MTAPTVADLAEAQFVLLTTFRKDGRGVPTPVWVAPLPGGLGVWTTADAGKVKRIRREGRVTLAACDRRGRPLGPEIEAGARVLDADGRERVLAAIRRKYGLVGRIATFASLLRRGRDGAAGIAVTAAP